AGAARHRGVVRNPEGGPGELKLHGAKLNCAKLYCATTNRGKLREFQMALEDSIPVEPLPSLESIAPCEETGATFEDNALEKALYYSKYCAGYLFVDDSGLEVDALGGPP